MRTRYALNTLGLFAFTTLVVVSVVLGPMGAAPEIGGAVLPVILWLILLFAVTAGLPRLFVAEEETHTATALRLSATPSALFVGKLLYGLAVVFALEAVVAPLFFGMVQLSVASPGLLAVALAGGGYYTRLLARTVGPLGKDYALVPAAFAEREEYMNQIGELASLYGNVEVVPVDFANFMLPDRAEAIIKEVDRLAKRLIGFQKLTGISAVDVAEGHVGLLFADGAFLRQLEPGAHVFWTVTRKPSVKIVSAAPSSGPLRHSCPIS